MAVAAAAAPHATLSFLPSAVGSPRLPVRAQSPHATEAPQVKAATTMHRATLAARSLARSLLPPSGGQNVGRPHGEAAAVRAGGCVCMSENPAAAASATLAHSRSAAEGTEFIDLRESGGLERNQAGETRIVAGAGGHATCARPARRCPSVPT